MNKAIIIGSGIAGIATAARLLAKGYDVSVFEAAKETGGKIHSFEMGKYRFDAGPSLFTFPFWWTNFSKTLEKIPEIILII